MYTLAISVLFGVIASAIIVFIVNKVDSSEPKLPLLKAICIFTPMISVLGLFIAGKIIREDIPLREKVIAVTPLGATQNADGTHSFVIETKAWYEHKYRFFPRTADGTLIPWNLEGDQPVAIIEDPLLDNHGSLTIWERERDPAHHLMNWALFTETDRRITKYVFRVPPGTVVHHVGK